MEHSKVLPCKMLIGADYTSAVCFVFYHIRTPRVGVCSTYVRTSNYVYWPNACRLSTLIATVTAVVKKLRMRNAVITNADGTRTYGKRTPNGFDKFLEHTNVADKSSQEAADVLAKLGKESAAKAAATEKAEKTEADAAEKDKEIETLRRKSQQLETDNALTNAELRKIEEGIQKAEAEKDAATKEVEELKIKGQEYETNIADLERALTPPPPDAKVAKADEPTAAAVHC